MSMISEQVKELREMADYWRSNGLEPQNALRKAADTIEALSEKLKAANMKNSGDWISCSERLPEENGPVLCWVRSTTIASGETYIIGSCNNGFWFLKTYEIGSHSFPVKDYKVIAWQPLPEPYKGR